MAITLIGTNGLVASGIEKVSDRSVVVTFTAATQVGDLLYLGVAYDNASITAPVIESVVDSRGNTWSLNGPEANASVATAAAAVRLSGMGCAVTVAHQIGDTLTITYNVGTAAVTAKAGIVFGLRGAATNGQQGTASTQGTTGGGSRTVTPATAGQAVVGFAAHEHNSVPTGDSDTTNGSWSTAVGTNTTGGSATTNVGIVAQAKIVTAGGAQTWNVTTTNDYAMVAWYVELPGLNVNVGQAVETDTAGAVTADLQRVGQAVETDTAGVVTPAAYPSLTLPFRDDFDRADSATEGNDWDDLGAKFEIESQRLKGDFTSGPLANATSARQTAGVLPPADYVVVEALVWLTPDAFDQGSLHLWARHDPATGADERDPCIILRSQTGGTWDLRIQFSDVATGLTGVQGVSLPGPVDSEANAARIAVSCEPYATDPTLIVVRGYLAGIEVVSSVARDVPPIGYLAAGVGGQTIGYFEWITASVDTPVPDPVATGWTVGRVMI